MKNRFIYFPNLPQNNVTAVIAAPDDSLKEILSKRQIKVIETSQNSFLESPVAFHADMLVHHLSSNRFIVDNKQKDIINFLENNDANILLTEKVKSPYPYECRLNCADIGDYIICNSKITDPNILNKNKKLINIKQGYAKCSICIIDKNKIITDDLSVFNAVSKYSDITALLVEKGSVVIEKYGYGFIGGCSGLIGKHLLFFNGDLSLHSDYNKICNFLYDNGVSYIDIKHKPLTDIGGILPIMELEDG
ncbi:MAG: hypothetical protein J1F23_01305 [Oscillospiraceae bacterium]|nr:hypothetical protein [Oscillospiraceae bacterium]